MADFAHTAEALKKAREQAKEFATLEANLMCAAISEAKGLGMSVRTSAAALDVPSSTVGRHWNEGHHCPKTT